MLSKVLNFSAQKNLYKVMRSFITLKFAKSIASVDHRFTIILIIEGENWLKITVIRSF